MKADVFKKLIKEAVREAVREELQLILNETVEVEDTPKAVEQVQRPVQQPIYNNYTKSADPITEMLNMTRASMNQDDYRSIMNGTSDMVSAPGLGMNPIDQFRPGPQPGIDLSTLDFVKKAGAIYKASVEKDKQRAGV